MLKKVLLAGVASMVMISAAQAADVIEPTAYDWTGAYIGLQGGYAWGDSDVEIDAADGSGPVGGSAGDDEIVVDAREGGIKTDGFIGGAHLGYNFQADALVFGLEGDIEYSGISGEADILQSEGDDPIGEASKDINWLGSLRLRGGFAMDRALFYATGGLAVGEIRIKSEAPNAFVTETGTEWGWTIGGGLEYAVTDDLSARIEYRYTELEDSEIENALGTSKVENNFHAVRAGLSWHFGNM